MLNLKNITKIYFVGIGGISMSALALLMHKQGKIICGCDDNQSKILEKLKKEGIKIRKHIYRKGLNECDLVVYTNAINKDNENLVIAKNLKKQILERAEFLGEICKTFKTVVAISGTHGKTTTTAMISKVLEDLNPTTHIGGILNDKNENLIIGNNDIFITEACEYNKSFLHINPTYLVVTNIEKDHMDCYKNFSELKQTFKKIIEKTSKNIVILNKFSSFYNKNFANSNFETFSINQNSTYIAKNIKEENGCYSFDIFFKQKHLGNIKLSVPGKHNILNALSTLCIARHFDIPFQTIKCKLENFKNVLRRFEIVYKNSITIISDYAHHPTEIKATINTAKKLSHNKIICVFEPHTYSRTISLFKEFLTCFDCCDKLILLKTYAAREKEIQGGTAFDLYLKLKDKINVSYCPTKIECFKELENITEKNDMILFVGAGTIDTFCREYVKTHFSK